MIQPINNPAALLLIGIISLASANLLQPLQQNASFMELMYQPALDFDESSCYHTAAIDAKDGSTNEGLGFEQYEEPQETCRGRMRLENSNVYSRKRCNNGTCAIMYSYYFEKDAMKSPAPADVRHEWENIVVFVRGEQVVYVAPSCAVEPDNDSTDPTGYFAYGDGYNFHLGDRYRGYEVDPRYPGHPLVRYHQKGIYRHCFRNAEEKGLRELKNTYAKWFRGPLVGWDHWPSESLRDKMIETWPERVVTDDLDTSSEAKSELIVPRFDGVTPRLSGREFDEAIALAVFNAGSEVIGPFDPRKDEHN